MRAYRRRAVKRGFAASCLGAAGGAAGAGVAMARYASGVVPDALAFVPGWPRKWRVGANSPSLCPTMSSVTNTFTNVLPLWTRKLWFTNSGEIVDRRDQVLIGSCAPAPFAFVTLASSLGSMYGPFFHDRLIYACLCPRLLTPGSRLFALGSWFPLPGSRF